MTYAAAVPISPNLASRSAARPQSAPALFGIVEHAIAAFERIHGLEITVHDLSGSLSPFLRPDRFHHRSALCEAVKAEGRLEACMQFDMVRTRHELASQPEGRVHMCHAGLIEWVVPVFSGGALDWVIFAGPRFPGPDLAFVERPQMIPWPRSPWGKIPVQLPKVGEAEAQLILEHLRQLAARLRYFTLELSPNRPRRLQGDQAPDATATRQVAILRFIEENYAEPATLAMLAKKLSLSESRTSHVVQRSCNASFRELLVQKRLRVAMDLLRQSGMSVLEVALASGFEDVAHFHRLFRRRVGMTPGKYRISGKA